MSGNGGCEPGCRTCGVSLCSGVPAVVRMVLGGLLILAGYIKLGNGDFAYDSVKAFQLGLGDAVLQELARVVPWAELITGVLLVLGLWARGAALMTVVMMLAYMAAIASVMSRGMTVKCGCFGALQLFCGDKPMGVCHLVRNSVMAAGGVLVLVMGPGVPAVDNLLRRRGSTPPGI
jgi:uncharacterized membrane protein YphA (DoxX/SURF4 family)